LHPPPATVKQSLPLYDHLRARISPHEIGRDEAQVAIDEFRLTNVERPIHRLKELGVRPPELPLFVGPRDCWHYIRGNHYLTYFTYNANVPKRGAKRDQSVVGLQSVDFNAIQYGGIDGAAALLAVHK